MDYEIIDLINYQYHTQMLTKTCIFFALLIQHILSLSLKLGNTTNDLIQTGNLVITKDYFTTSQTLDFTRTLDYTMSAVSADAALGVADASFDCEEGEVGWEIIVEQIQDTLLGVSVTAPYFPNTIARLKLRYIVSVHPLLEIEYFNLVFDVSDKVTDVFSVSSSDCDPLYCRETLKNIAYQTKNIMNDIKGMVTLIGFHADFSTNLTTINGITKPTYFGIDIQLNSFTATEIQTRVRMYSFANLLSISIYHITYEELMTNTQVSKTLSGRASVGCFYNNGGCDPTDTNNSFTTQSTFVETIYEDNYFYGINKFIVKVSNNCDSPLNANSFSVTNQERALIGNNICLPAAFTTGANTLDVTSYKTAFSFTGNPQKQFSITFSYLIDISMYCPVTGDLYYQQDMINCDTVCNGGVKQYADPITNICDDCDSRCRKCIGPTQTECTGCYNSHNRALVGNECVCKDGFYDENMDKCAQCHYSCLTCFGADLSMCLSCQLADFRYDDGNMSCPCLPGYFDGGSDTCVICHYTCETCEGGENSDNCVTCDLINNFRQINVASSKCLCIDHYYHQNNNPVCQLCHYTCLTCFGPNFDKCKTCNTTALRSLDTNKQCICVSGFYDDGVNEMCLPCHFSCQECDGGSAEDCTDCDPSLNYGLNVPTQECLCIENFFRFNFSCYDCHYTCFNCTGQNRDECTSCSDTDFRIFNITNNQCQCMTGYYDDYLNKAPICLPCDYRCETCEDVSTNCLSCDPLDDRSLTGNSCPCIYGYVEVFFGFCSICHYSCETCTDTTDTGCLTCNNTIRYFDAGSCLCRTQTYDNGIQEECKPCDSKCAECVGPTDSDCLQCDPVLYRQDPPGFPDYCPCIDGYYDIATNNYCQKCHDFCLTCQYTSTHCTSCDPVKFRSLEISTNQCICFSHYFTNGNPICQICADQCLECSERADNCTACDNLLNLVYGAVLGTDINKCECINSYYEDLITGDCLPCDPLCSTCQNTSTTCLSCTVGLFRIKDGINCVCEVGYYDDGSLDCKPCPYYCPNCTIGSVCLSCADTTRDLTTGCDCRDGYYNQGINPICQLCVGTCLTCTTFSVCQTCYTDQNRKFSVDECICEQKFYEESGNVVCQPCHYTCLTCTGGTEFDCQSCESLRTQNTLASTCDCQAGYFQAADTYCYLCDDSCKTCDVAGDNCTDCYNLMVLSGNKCICSDGTYFDTGTLNCQPCDFSCKRCEVTAEHCLECYESTQQTSLVGNDCICKDGYFLDINTNICEPCHQTCRVCNGQNNNECLACFQTTQLRVYDPVLFMCLCSSGYYSGTGALCQKCNAGCSQCYGGSIYECTVCNNGYILIGTFCKKEVICKNYYYEGKCLNVCPNTTYPIQKSPTNYCQRCIQPCLACITQTRCLSCIHGAFYNASTQKCYNYCPIGYYIDRNGNCVICPTNCTDCVYSPQHNKALCTLCISGYIVVDGNICLSECPQLTHVMNSNLCLKCIGNCETCTELSINKCLTCRQNTNFLNGYCHQVCPEGYYQSQSTCLKCNITCKTCFKGQCLTCTEGFYMNSQKQCIQIGFFVDEKNISQKCHPNCLTCTNSSFSSCIMCPPQRGISGNMAESGYCNCRLDTIDIGMGKCDSQSYSEIVTANKALLSGTYSTFFMSAIVSIISTNYILSYNFLNYLQTYSSYFYLNSTTHLMQMDKILESYRLTNMMAWMQTTEESPYSTQRSQQIAQRQTRILQEYASTQINESLFLRGYSEIYLIDLCAFMFWAVVIIWIIDFGTYMGLRCCAIRKEKSENSDEEEEIHSRGFDLQMLEKSDRHPILKAIIQFYEIYHQSVAIIFHLCISTEVTLLAIASSKMLLTSNYLVDYSKLIPSILFTLFIFCYTIRLLVLAIILKKPVDYRNIRILYAMHVKQKLLIVASRVYIPLILIRNQLAMIFMVALSEDPVSQLAVSGTIYLVFTLYSVFACPYPGTIRIFVHVQEILFLGQIILLAVAVNSFFGDYTAAILLLVLNYLQIACYFGFGVSILVMLVRKKLGNKNQVTNQFEQNKKLQNPIQPKSPSGKSIKQSQQKSRVNLSESLATLKNEEQQHQIDKIESFSYAPPLQLQNSNLSQEPQPRINHPFEQTHPNTINNEIDSEFSTIRSRPKSGQDNQMNPLRIVNKKKYRIIRKQEIHKKQNDQMERNNGQ